MTKTAQIDADELIDPAEFDRCTLFNALKATPDRQEFLVDVWQRCAPDKPFNDFVCALAVGGARLALQMADRSP